MSYTNIIKFLTKTTVVNNFPVRIWRKFIKLSLINLNN